MSGLILSVTTVYLSKILFGDSSPILFSLCFQSGTCLILVFRKLRRSKESLPALEYDLRDPSGLHFGNEIWISDQCADSHQCLTLPAQSCWAGQRDFDANYSAVLSAYVCSKVKGDFKLFVTSCNYCISSVRGNRILRQFDFFISKRMPTNWFNFTAST